MDDAMKWVMERGRFKGVVAKRDALCVTLKKEITTLERTQTQHFANYIEMSQKVKIAKLVLFVAEHAKSTLDN